MEKLSKLLNHKKILFARKAFFFSWYLSGGWKYFIFFIPSTFERLTKNVKLQKTKVFMILFRPPSCRKCSVFFFARVCYSVYSWNTANNTKLQKKTAWNFTGIDCLFYVIFLVPQLPDFLYNACILTVFSIFIYSEPF